MRNLAVWAVIALLASLSAGCPKRSGTFNPRSRFEAPEGGDAKARARFEEARSRFERDDPAARAEFEAIAREFPDDPIAGHASLYAGMAAHRKGNHPEALRLLSPLVGDPKVTEDVKTRARFYLGVSSAYAGKHQEARTLLEPFLGKVAPGEEEGELLAALAETAAALEDREKALEYYDAFFKIARPAEREYVIAKVRVIVDALPPDAVRRAWDRADKSRASAAFLARRLAVLDPANGRAYLDDSAQSRENVGLADEGRGTAGGGDPQIVGALLPLSGNTKRVGDLAMRGLAAAAGTYQVTAGGGGGAPQPFTVVVKDSSSSPEQARVGFEELVQANVIAIVGPVDKDAAEEAARRAESARVPLISLDVANPALGAGSPHVFRIVVSVEGRARALARAASARGLKSFAILVPEHSYGARGARAFREEIERLGGKVLVEEKYAKDATAFVDPVKKIAAKPVEALFVPDSAAKLELIAPQLAVANLIVQAPGAQKSTRGRSIALLSTAEALSPKFLKGTGRYTQGAILAPGFYPDDADARIAPFVTRFRNAYGGEDPDYLAAYAWDAAVVIRAAVEGGARDRAAVLAAMASGKVAGVTGDIQFDASRQRSDAGVLFTVQGQAIKVWRP
jgi:branched-chain amino acid transport system substrate-binding protein